MHSFIRFNNFSLNWGELEHTICESESCLVLSDSLWPCGLYNPWNSPGRNTGVASLSLLLGILPTQGLSPDLLLCRQNLYQLSHKGRSNKKGNYWKMLYNDDFVRKQNSKSKLISLISIHLNFLSWRKWA